METITEKTKNHLEKQLVEKNTNWLDKQAINFEKSRFALMAIFITVQSCLGSIACMYILKNNANELVLASCAAVTMASNSLFIAQGSAKICLILFYLSIVVNSLLVLYYAFQTI